MLKKEFLDVLNQKLSLISDKEREDIILEYGTYIDDKIAGGVAEEEAVAGFGDVDYFLLYTLFASITIKKEL